MTVFYCSDCISIILNEHVDLISALDVCWCSKLTVVYHHYETVVLLKAIYQRKYKCFREQLSGSGVIEISD